MHILKHGFWKTTFLTFKNSYSKQLSLHFIESDIGIGANSPTNCDTISRLPPYHITIPENYHNIDAYNFNIFIKLTTFWNKHTILNILPRELTLLPPAQGVWLHSSRIRIHFAIAKLSPAQSNCNSVGWLIGSRISLKPAWAELGTAQSQLVSWYCQSKGIRETGNGLL